MSYERILFANGAQSKLSLAMAASGAVTSLTLASGGGSLFPAITRYGDYFLISVMSSAGYVEVMKVTARTADVLTVVRGWEGTAILAFDVNNLVVLAPTAGTMRELQSTSWARELNAVSYASANSFTVATDQTARYTQYRRVRLTQTEDGVATVASSSFGGGYTTVIIGAGQPVDEELFGVDFGPEAELLEPRPLVSGVDIKTINGDSILGAGNITIVAGGGGGVTKYANLAAIEAIATPAADDLAIAQDTGMMFQYRNSVWVSAFNTFTDPTSQGNWQLVGKKTFVGTVPTGSFDISGCNRFRVEIDQGGTSSGNILAQFGADSGSNYNRQTLYGRASTATAQYAAYMGIFVSGAYPFFKTLEFSRVAKQGVSVVSVNNTGLYSQQEAWEYVGTDPMNTLTLSAGSYTMTGTISVYKWVEQAVPAELACYELVKEYTLSNETLSDTIAWDGDTYPEVHMVCESDATGTASWIHAQPNGDTTAANYSRQSLQGAAAVVTAGATTTATGLYTANCGTSKQSIVDMYLGRKGARVAMAHVGSGTAVQSMHSSWSNTVSPVTSITFTSSGVQASCNIKIYRLAKTQLVTTNPNLNTLSSSYVSADVIQIKPGEIEINGAVCLVSKATNVALSTNLQAGLSEAPSTVYYLYAKRGAARACTFMFSTTAPLMDRYGNSAASFAACDPAHAWFHPTLGLDYRYIGFVENDASSNLKSFSNQLVIPSAAIKVVPTAVNYTAVSLDKVLTTAAVTITLKNSANATISVKNAAAYIVTVLPESGTIDGQTSHRIMNQYDSVDYMCDGTNWWVI